MAGWWLRRRSAARLAELDALRAPLLAATEAEGGEGANAHPSFDAADPPVPSGLYSVTAPGAEATIFARLGGFVAVAGSVAEARQAGGWAGGGAGVCSALSQHEPGARQMRVTLAMLNPLLCAPHREGSGLPPAVRCA